MTAAVEVHGSRELRRSLKAAGDDLGDLKDAHKLTGDYVANAASGRAPRRSGALAGSLRASRIARGVAVKAGSAKVRYAGPIHYGWPAHNIRAQPFVVDAAHATEEHWLGIYADEVERIVGEIKGASS